MSPMQDPDPGQLLPRTAPAPAASPTQRALRFVRSRDGRLALLSMALLVFQGTALSLTLRVSRCARPHVMRSTVLANPGPLCKGLWAVGPVNSAQARHGAAGLSGPCPVIHARPSTQRPSTQRPPHEVSEVTPCARGHGSRVCCSTCSAWRCRCFQATALSPTLRVSHARSGLCHEKLNLPPCAWIPVVCCRHAQHLRTWHSEAVRCRSRCMCFDAQRPLRLSLVLSALPRKESADGLIPQDRAPSTTSPFPPPSSLSELLRHRALLDLRIGVL